MPLAQPLTLLPRMVADLLAWARGQAGGGAEPAGAPPSGASRRTTICIFWRWCPSVRVGAGRRPAPAGLRPIDRARAATYLETATERNLALYQRHGFAVTGEARLPSDGPKLWFLWRAPQAE